MNENIKAVFEILGVEPNEPFKIRYPNNSMSLYKYRITGKLIIERDNCWIKSDCCDYLRKLLTREYKIIKQPKFTDIEQKAIELYKMLGYKYIAKDKNSYVFVYKTKPMKQTTYWEEINDSTGHELLPELELKFNCLSWTDTKPYYIGD